MLLVEPITTATTHEFCAQIVLLTCAPIAAAAMPSATATSTSTRRAIKTFHAHQLSLERNVAPGAPVRLTDSPGCPFLSGNCDRNRRGI